jgi:hypothetical protein
VSSEKVSGAMAAALRVHSEDWGSTQAHVARLAWLARGVVIQRTLAHGRSIAARGLGLGMKGNGQWVIGAGVVVAIIIVFIIAQTAETAAVARGWFAQMCRLQAAGLGGVQWDGAC